MGKFLISEEIEQDLYHLSPISSSDAICGAKSVVLTDLCLDYWDSVKSCEACNVKVFGWPDSVLNLSNHPLYISCRIMDLFDSFSDAYSLTSGLKDSKNLFLGFALLVLKEADKNGPRRAIERSKKLWELSSSNHLDGTSRDDFVELYLERAFLDFNIHWRNH